MNWLSRHCRNSHHSSRSSSSSGGNYGRSSNTAGARRRRRKSNKSSIIVEQLDVAGTSDALAAAGVHHTETCKADDRAGGLVALLRAAAVALWLRYCSRFVHSFGSSSSGRYHDGRCLTIRRKTLTMLMIFSVAPSRKTLAGRATDRTTDDPSSSFLFDQASSIASSLYSKMVADEALIQSNRRLSEKAASQQQLYSSPSSSSGNEGHPQAEYGAFNTTLAASIVLGNCCCSCHSSSISRHDNNRAGDTDPESSSLFEFKLSAGHGRGMLCVPIPFTPAMDEEKADSWYSPVEEQAQQPQHYQREGTSKLRYQNNTYPCCHEEEGNSDSAAAASAAVMAWPWFLPQIDLTRAPGSEVHIKYSLSSTYSSYGERNATWWIRNCFGLSDEEDSIGLPFEYTQVPPQGAMVQVSCSRSNGHDRLNQNKNCPQGKDDKCLDFVIVLLDEDDDDDDDDDVAAPDGEEVEENSRRNVIVESQVAQIAIPEEQEDLSEEAPSARSEPNLRISSNHHHRETAQTQPPPQQRTKQVTLIRPILMDSQSTIRGIRAEAFQVSSRSVSSSVSFPSSLSHPRTKDEDHADSSSSGSSSSTIHPPPPQYHHHSKHNPLIHVQADNIVQRVLDGKHDNVLAITLPTDCYYSSDYSFRGKEKVSSYKDDDKKNATTILTEEQEEAGPKRPGKDSIRHQRRQPSNNNDNTSNTNDYSKDVVVLLHYEMETKQGKVYQRTHIVSSHHPPSSAPGFPFLGPTLRPRPVWIESTQLTVYGDIRVNLAGLSSSSSFVPPTTTSPLSSEKKNSGESRLRRFLCTIRVGLIVENVEPEEHESKVGVEPQLHSLVDIAAMVTSDAPILMVHVGWIRKGLEALQLSSSENITNDEPWPSGLVGWDVHIEDVLCQDPNLGYQVTHTLQDEGEEEAAVNASRGGRHHRDLRRRLFARMTDHQNYDIEEEDNNKRNNKKGNKQSVARTIAAARQLMSRVPTQEEREVHEEMCMGRRPEVWSTLTQELDEEQEYPEEIDGHHAQPPNYHPDRRLVGWLNPKMEGAQPQLEPGVHRFILTHGYCALNTWPHNDFIGKGYEVIRFEDPYESKSHDDFAFAIREAVCPYKEVDSHMIISGNIVAHSQGGAAALHLKNFYWSCLDNNPYAGYRIQALGTPFQGTNLAGVAATLAAIFGVGCNSVYDMTEQGAAEWLKHIQPWARKRVTYYRTQYKVHPNSKQKDYCHLLTHAIIGAPNDGVVQVGRGILPGGIDGGVKMMQCHVIGMRDPPQVEDTFRNRYMRQVAAVPPQ